MNQWIKEHNKQVLCGNSFEILKEFPDESVDCVVTSPPYWPHRSYGESTVIEQPDGKRWQLGLEDDPQEFIGHLTDLFRTVRAKLKTSGSVWLNLGDCYWSKGKQDNWRRPKQLMMIPVRVALAMQEDGWILRSTIIWAKANSLPESCSDRVSNKSEYIFHFTKSEEYFFDLNEIKVPYKSATVQRYNYSTVDFSNSEGVKATGPYKMQDKSKIKRKHLDLDAYGANPGNVWNISVACNSEKHYASYPEELVERPVKATCPKEVCTTCGHIRTKVIEKEGKSSAEYMKESVPYTGGVELGKDKAKYNSIQGQTQNLGAKGDAFYRRNKVVGYNECSCGTGYDAGVVIDPFTGSGTTLLVAGKLGMNWVGIEMNPEFVGIANKRLREEIHQMKII